MPPKKKAVVKTVKMRSKRKADATLEPAAIATKKADLVSFEDSLAELEAAVHDLENGELGLAESLERYEQGIQHLKHCYSALENAERRVELLREIGENGEPVTDPFDEQEMSLEDKAAARSRRRTATTSDKVENQPSPTLEARSFRIDAANSAPKGPSVDAGEEEADGVDGSAGLF